MSKMASLIFLAVAVSLIFISGCKDKPKPDVAPIGVAPVETQPDESTEPATDLETASAPVGKITEVHAEPVVATVSDEKKPEVGGHDAWITDYKAAMKKAAEEKKDMLLEFTGSDWCPGCIKFNEEVFSKKEFLDEASKDFVLVFLDSPRGKKLAPGLEAQNNQLAQKYGVQYLPTICLTDANGRPYAQTTGYQAGGPKAYLAQLADMRKSRTQVADLIAKTESTELDNVEKAKLLDKAINLMSPELVDNFYSDLIDKVIAFDSENKAGLRDNYLAKKAAQQAVEQLQAGNIDKGIEMIDKIISDYKMNGQTTQEIYYLKALAIRSKGDDSAVLENLKKAVAAAPESEMGMYIKGVINDHFSKPAPEPEPTPVTAVEKTTE